jgi:hypothetical protein
VSAPGPPRVCLRIFADCATADAAHDLQQQLLRRLAPWQAQPVAVPRRYWKVPTQSEFMLELAPATLQTFDAVRALGAGPWHDSGDKWALSSVWNRQGTSSFLLPAVAWADLEWISPGESPAARS